MLTAGSRRSLVVSGAIGLDADNDIGIDISRRRLPDTSQN